MEKSIFHHFDSQNHGKNHKWNHTNDTHGSRADKGVAAIKCEVNTYGRKTVDGTMGQNGGNAAACFQGHIGHKYTQSDAEQAHHADACERETGVSQAVIMANDGQRCMPQTPNNAGNQQSGKQGKTFA